MSAPLTYGIAAKAKHADCAAFFLNWVATERDGAPDRRHRRRLEPGWPDGPGRCPPVAAGSVTNDTLAAGAVVAQGQRRDGLHRQRDRLDLRAGLDARAPEDGRRASRPPTACSRPSRRSTETNSPVTAAQSTDRWPTTLMSSTCHRELATLAGGSPLLRGVRRRTSGRLAVRAAGARDVRRVRPPAAVPDASSTRSIAGTASGRRRGSGFDNYVKVLTDPDLVESRSSTRSS